MAHNIYDFDTNKNAVIVWYNFGNPKPYGCVCKYNGYFIKASIWFKGFQVYSSCNSKVLNFGTLRQAKRYINSKNPQQLILF